MMRSRSVDVPQVQVLSSSAELLGREAEFPLQPGGMISQLLADVDLRATPVASCAARGIAVNRSIAEPSWSTCRGVCCDIFAVDQMLRRVNAEVRALGEYWRSRPLMFSFDGRCHGVGCRFSPEDCRGLIARAYRRNLGD